MTYLVPRSIQRYRKRRALALSGWLDDLMQKIAGQPSEESQCLDQANATLAPFDAKIDDLAKTWNPTGFYKPDEIRSLVQSTLQVTRQAYDALTKAAAEPNASGDSISRATDDLGRDGQRSLDYLQAATDAERQGLALVNAPGFKRWVTDTMATTSSAMVTAAVIGCVTPWWVGTLAAFAQVFEVLYQQAKLVLGAVLAVGQTALNVARDLPEIYDILKWGALAAAAYWIWTEISSRHHRP